MLVPIPEIDEQNEIADSLALVDVRVANAAAKKTQLKDLFRTLLQEFMTARIRVNNLDMNISN